MTKLFARIHSAYVNRDLSREEGQGVVEYALVLGVLVVALFVAFNTAGVAGGITAALGGIVTTLTP